MRPSRFCTTKRLWKTMRTGASRLENRISRITLSVSRVTPPYQREVRDLNTISTMLSTLGRKRISPVTASSERAQSGRQIGHSGKRLAPCGK